MVFRESILTVADNCGAKRVKCVGSFANASSGRVKLGTFLKVSIRRRDPHKELLKIDQKVFLAVLVTARRNQQRVNGHNIRFARNNVIILGSDNRLFATRLKGPVCRELRSADVSKILVLARKIV